MLMGGEVLFQDGLQKQRLSVRNTGQRRVFFSASLLKGRFEKCLGLMYPKASSGTIARQGTCTSQEDLDSKDSKKGATSFQMQREEASNQAPLSPHHRSQRHDDGLLGRERTAQEVTHQH